MNKILGPEQGYIELLDAATVKRVANEAANPKRKYDPRRPSSAGKCTRELAYELADLHGIRKFQKEEQSAELTRIFGLGHHVENHVLQEFRQNLPEFEQRYKQQVLEFFPITAKNMPELAHVVEGSLDTCFYSPVTRGIADVKSKKDRFSPYRKSAWDETAEKLSRMKSVQTISDKFYWAEDLGAFLKELADPFFESNFLQLNGYACTKFMRDRGIDHGSILQFNKNDSRMREVRFKPSMELFEAMRLKFQAATDAVDQGAPELAPKDHLLGSIKCAYCPFKSACWENDDALKAFYNTFGAKQWPKDTNKMGPLGRALEAHLVQYAAAQEAGKAGESVETEMLKLLTDAKVQKVRFKNGDVYEVKFLKSPHPRFELRRSKA